MFLTFGLIFLFLMLCGGLFGSHMDRYDWNSGNCSVCGEVWVRFSTSSQGCRGYTCRMQHKPIYIWISWPGIDKL